MQQQEGFDLWKCKAPLRYVLSLSSVWECTQTAWSEAGDGESYCGYSSS